MNQPLARFFIQKSLWFASLLLAALALVSATSAWSASPAITGATPLVVSGKYVGGTNGFGGTSWTTSDTNFAYRLSGTTTGKNNRNTPNGSGDTSGTVDPHLNSVASFRLAPNGTVTISGAFGAPLKASDFSLYGGQYLTIGLINQAWIDNAKSGYNSDLFSSAAGANGNAHLIFYRETLSAPVFAAMEDHTNGRASSASQRDLAALGSLSAFAIQFQNGLDQGDNPVAVGGRMRYALNNGAYGPWENNSHDFSNQDTALQLSAFTSLGYNFSASLATIEMNISPLAANDSYSINEDAVLTTPAPGVLANDSDPEGDLLNAALLSGPSNGSLALNADGSFSYTPNANFNGVDSFSYQATDAQGAQTPATVNITITPVNDPPTASADTYTTAEDTLLAVPAAGVLANDSDLDAGDTLSAVLLSGPSNGSLALNADGSFSYTPNANYSGVDSFSYTATDSKGEQTPATVNITVTPANDPPTASADSYMTAEDTPLSVPAAGVLANDSDPDAGDTLSAALLSGPSNGSLTLNADGSFRYTPNANYSGADSFSYQASDSASAPSAAATVTITVTPVNDPPVAGADSYTTAEDTALSVPAPGVLANDSDGDSPGPLSAALLSGPSNGSLTLNADGSFSYTPNANFNGADSFSYQASDSASASSAPATVTITITPVNDLPTASADSYTTAEDTPLSVPAPGVLANDSNPDAGAFNAALVSGPSNGILALNADGWFSYTPNANFNGADSFSYYANDAQNDQTAAVTVSITVTTINDAPAFTAGADQTVAEDAGAQAVSGWATNITAGPSDESGQTVAFQTTNNNNGLFATQPAVAADGTLTYTPAPDANGTATVTVIAQDNGGTAQRGVDSSSPQAFLITVTPTNDAPQALADTARVNVNSSANAINVLSNDSSAPDAPETLTITAVTQGTNGNVAIISNGSAVAYTPNADYTGADSFTYTISDGNGGSATATVAVTIGNSKLYLPLLVSARVAPTAPLAADLVGRFELAPSAVQSGAQTVVNVTITNNGSAPASQFWVDFYINPLTAPTATNQPWDKSCGGARCPSGIAWYVEGAIAPGQSITLQSTPDSYYAKNTIWPGYFTTDKLNLYMYVDSWNPGVTTGAVMEQDESNNRAELHIGATAAAPALLASPKSLEELPLRPLRPTRAQ